MKKSSTTCRRMEWLKHQLRQHFTKKMLQPFIMILLLHACFVNVFAQSKTITGMVRNDKGEPMPAVSVTLKGSRAATSANSDGRFSIDVPNGKGTLVFTYVGFAAKEISINNKTVIDVQLETEEARKLDEVVVVGYGTTKKATLTGAVSVVKGKEVLQSPATNVSNSLVGRLPGLVATQPSGEPGYDGSTIRIRGVNTTGNNDALVVVDGIPGRSLERIDPNSIESITILKDASAAIYGAQAANGVILITTKRGKTGKPEITLNTNYGYNQPTVLPKMADAPTYATMMNEIALYNGSPALYTDDDIKKYKDGSDPWGHPNTDWFKATLKPRSSQYATNVSLSGGNESTRYFVSVGYKHQDGNYYHSGTFYNQPDFRSNLDARISKYISVGFDLAGRLEDRNYPTRGAGDIFRMVQRGKPNLPAYWPNGLPGPDIEYGNNPVVISTDATGYNKDKYYALNSNLKLNIIIPWVKGLSITGNAGIDKGFDFIKLWQTPWYLYTWDGTSYDANNQPVLVKGKRGFDAPQLTETFKTDQQVVLNALINYEHTFGQDHAIKVLVGSEKREGKGENFNAFRQYYVSPSIDQLFAGGSLGKDNNGSAYINERLNYFGRVNYSYKEKYLAEFVWRYDGSYIFPEDHRFGFFPGVSLGWRVSEENFWKNNVTIIDNFKLRASWGQTGNDRIAEWQYLSTYAYGSFFDDPSANPPVYWYIPFVTNGSTENQTLYETRIPNPNATWELATQRNIGFEATLLRNKLSVEFDYFDYLRSKILAKKNASVPLSTGLILPLENIGKVSNKGFEFVVSYKDRVGDFNYQVSVNGSYARNKILFWDEAPGRPEYQRSTGKSIPTDPINNPDNNLYYQAIGVFEDQAAVDKYAHWSGARAGDIIFKDANGDGVIDGNDRVRNDKTNIPRFVGGLSINLQYKGFDLSVLMQGATGAVNYISTESGEIGDYLQSFAKDRWTPDHTKANTPRTFNRTNEYYVSQRNTFWLRKTDYLRLKTFQVGYSIPPKAIHKTGIQNIRIYISGFNVFTYSPDYKDFDPEASGGDGHSYPLQKVLTAGLSLTF